MVLERLSLISAQKTPHIILKKAMWKCSFEAVLFSFSFLRPWQELILCPKSLQLLRSDRNWSGSTVIEVGMLDPTCIYCLLVKLSTLWPPLSSYSMPKSTAKDTTWDTQKILDGKYFSKVFLENRLALYWKYETKDQGYIGNRLVLIMCPIQYWRPQPKILSIWKTQSKHFNKVSLNNRYSFIWKIPKV